MSLRALARELDVSAAYLSDVERGRKPCPERLVRAAASALGHSTAELISLTEEKVG